MDDSQPSSGFIGTDIPTENEMLFTEIEILDVPSAGYTRIYQCRRYGKTHILKALHPSYRGMEPYETLLRKEFEIGYQLEHPHICHTLGWEHTAEIGNFILQEYIDGITLGEFIHQGKLTELLARKFITEICEALHYIHSKQVIQRDLKPDNILVTHNGQNVKLIDFGLADRDDYVIGRIPAGTQAYIAPELFQKDATWDVRTDIYSLGVIISEMGEVLHDRILWSISQKCMQADCEKRYPNVDVLMMDINRKKPRLVYWIGSTVVCILVSALIIWGAGLFSVNRITEDNLRTYGNSSLSVSSQEELFINKSDSIAALHDTGKSSPLR